MTALLPTLLLISLALVMLGVGLSLSLEDFARLRRHPKAVAIALLLQMLLLPLACFAMIKLVGLPPAMAVGLMLLAASPGGVSANLFSHLFGGHVALNISLTAINTLLSVITMPLIANLALQHFIGEGIVPLQTAKVAEVMAVVLLPVVVGMSVARWRPALAARLEKPFKIFSAVVLALLALGAIAKEWRALADSAASIGGIVLVFNLLSLLSGYYLSRALGLAKAMATAISFEIGIHNSTLALYIALSVLQNFQMALPAAAYSVSMYVVGTVFGLWLRRGDAAPRAAEEGAGTARR
ncbi:bile acid:sodium symporter family protein [Paucibacter sp. PLA-PC-4]|uniref:bile acid:sodium symporter family protein n=1 Tax=Paucibacter sp. PLA-PC-4 TaxID=2993655 RepID=UPI00224B4E86|nr:bile acid:sodium symporter family protein [Paucibacter sp. PLA-PC-4]MCX2864041.1 bile acid:sodium symporter family protein [Paucibacter sp. PLA-PC-4]